jgi:Uma2 family endonuclease
MPSSLKLTYADLVALPEDGKRHELIDGEHLVTPSPTPRHQLVLGNLHWLIASFVREHALGQVFFAPLDVLLSEINVLEPDLLYVARERLGIIEAAFIRGAPDLVVEVLSPSTCGRDRGVKLRAYEQWGIGEYWIVDPEGETVEVFRRTPAGLERLALARRAGGGVLESPLFPGLALDLEQVFA